ncbi:MAG: NAD-dependent epimerase/dehydratase family protein [Bacillota bacterium]
MKILVTGSNGFVGRNLIVVLKQVGYADEDVLCYDIDKSFDDLIDYVEQADFVIHLAGVNRPQSVEEFKTGNMDLTAKLVELLLATDKKPPLLLSSSIQAVLENPYGASKLGAEVAVAEYSRRGGRGIIFRLPNVFGKWCRPNYNSAVATFCYNISHDLPILISDRSNKVNLVYIDDVVRAFVHEVERCALGRAENSAYGALGRTGSSALGIGEVNDVELGMVEWGEVSPVITTTVGELADLIYSFQANRLTKIMPDLSNYFTKCLYSTYLSYLEKDNFSYALNTKSDERGWLAELIKSEQFGQVFVSKTKSGITRGNHYHNTKVEKFCVISGSGIIRFRHISDNAIICYEVNDADLRVVDIPPGYTHSIENTGLDEMITLFWSNEIFDSLLPDTYWEIV